MGDHGAGFGEPAGEVDAEECRVGDAVGEAAAVEEGDGRALSSGRQCGSGATLVARRRGGETAKVVSEGFGLIDRSVFRQDSDEDKKDRFRQA